MITKMQIENVRKHWTNASINLGFTIITPFFIEIKGQKKEVFAYVPRYGSPNGTIISLTSSPNFDIDYDVIDWCKKNNFFFSFINTDACLKFENENFKELLEDWNKY